MAGQTNTKDSELNEELQVSNSQKGVVVFGFHLSHVEEAFGNESLPVIKRKKRIGGIRG